MLLQKNGEPISQAIVSIEDRAFLYGDGCFSTMQFKVDSIMLWDRHLERFEHASKALRLNCDLDRLIKEKEIFLKWISAEGFLGQATIKILLSRGVGVRGYAVPDQPCDIYFYLYPMTTIHHSPSYLSTVGCIDEPLSTTFSKLKGVKTLNRLEQIMLKDTAIQRGWDEAVCFDFKQNVVEGISSNCFLFIDGQWVTPDLELSGIDGVMRREILSRMKYYEIGHQVRIITAHEICSATAGFMCNALHPMQIIEQLLLRDRSLKFDLKLCQQLYEILQLDSLV